MRHATFYVGIHGVPRSTATLSYRSLREKDLGILRVRRGRQEPYALHFSVRLFHQGAPACNYDHLHVSRNIFMQQRVRAQQGSQ